MPSREVIAAQYENNSIYVILSSRGALPGFHWGIYIPTKPPDGQVWHATNREGGWKLERKNSANVPFSMSLVVAYKIGSVSPSDWESCQDILSGVAADGRPSPNTGEESDCQTWAMDAIMALESNKIVTLAATLTELQARWLHLATLHKDNVETGRSSARVVNQEAPVGSSA